MPPQELVSFLAQVLALRAQREASHLSSSETVLLLRINHALPAELQHRFGELVAKRQAETITSDELHELIQITNDYNLNIPRNVGTFEAEAEIDMAAV